MSSPTLRRIEAFGSKGALRAENVVEALQTASSGPVAEGSVGGGTGMICCDFKGGIGTSSRKLPPALGGYTAVVAMPSSLLSPVTARTTH